jgi:hypothetical protein
MVYKEPMTTDIRRASATDAAAIAEVFLASRATMTYLPNLHSNEETRGFIRHVVSDFEVFAAERNGSIVGFAALNGDWLDHLYVHPSRFNTQTGSKLFHQATLVRPDGFQFWVFQQNIGARRFYERHGCALARMTDGRDNEEKTPDALYVWPTTRTPE